MQLKTKPFFLYQFSALAFHTTVGILVLHKRGTGETREGKWKCVTFEQRTGIVSEYLTMQIWPNSYSGHKVNQNRDSFSL